MNSEMKSRLIRLLNIYGVSSEEKQVRKYIRKELKSLVDYMKTDDYGNLIAVKEFGNVENGPVIMLNAHMDTVTGVSKKKVVKEENGIFRAYDRGLKSVLGADDRAGIAIVLSIVENVPSSFNGTIKIAFTREEEIGCVGASQMDDKFYKDVDLSITFDRRGNKDIVVGTYGVPFCSNEVGNALENISKSNNFEYKCVEGGISDAYEFSAYNINSVNLSVGYENEHTKDEFLVYKDMNIAYEFGIAILKDISMYDYRGFGDVPKKSNNWVGGYKNKKDKYYYSDYDLGYGYDSYDNYDNYGEIDDSPFVWVHKGKVIIDNTLDAVEFDKKHLDSLILQLQGIKNEINVWGEGEI